MTLQLKKEISNNKSQINLKGQKSIKKTIYTSIKNFLKSKRDKLKTQKLKKTNRSKKIGNLTLQFTISQ